MLRLEELFASYPPASTPEIQTIIGSKKEFHDLANPGHEILARPGDLFSYQRFVQRYLRAYDRLLMMWETGTGKTCGIIGVAEYYHDLYLNSPQTAPIKRCYYLVNTPLLKDEIKNQIVCKCTDGRYLSENVLTAKTEKGRKKAITQELDKWYKFDTYSIFASKIKKMTPAEITEKFSHCLFVCDEVHNFTVEEDELREQQRKSETFSTIENLFHTVEPISIILATATPMINKTTELEPIIRLLAKENLAEISRIDFNSPRLEEIEPFLRGKVSYVRAGQLGVEVVTKGESIPLDITENRKIIDQRQVTLYLDLMGDIQANAYLTIEDDTGVFANKRQAANFVFPDGSWGGSLSTEQSQVNYGFGKYITKKGKKYIPLRSFRPWLRLQERAVGAANPDNYLDRLSSKYANTIRLVKDSPKGTCFVYNTIVFGSGAILQGLCFEENGFTEYTGEETVVITLGNEERGNSPCVTAESGRIIPTFSKRPRFAFITSEKTENEVNRILELFNSPQNVHGEYLKVIIGSEVAKEGLNLFHGVQVNIMTPWWHPNDNYQAISRVNRALSQQLLLEKQREELMAAGEDPQNAHVDIEVYYHAAIAEEDIYDLNNIDLYMYSVAEGKLARIKEVEYFLKRIAVDCYINRERNVLPSVYDYTSLCNYQPCDYPCYSSSPEYLDLETFVAYYLGEAALQFLDVIRLIFQVDNSYSIDIIYRMVEALYPDINISDSVIQYLLMKIVQDRIPLTNRDGVPSYLRENGDIFFLETDFPIYPFQREEYLGYNNFLISNDQLSSEEFIKNINSSRRENILTAIIEDDRADLIDQLLQEGKIELVETVILRLFRTGRMTAGMKATLERFQSYIFTTIYPSEDIQELRSSKFTKTQMNSLRYQDVISDRVKEIPLKDGIKTKLNGKKIQVLHTLYDEIINVGGYNQSKKTRKGNVKHLRYLIPADVMEWKSLHQKEDTVQRIVNRSIIEKLAAERISPWEEYEIYGIIIKEDPRQEFRIRNKIIEESLRTTSGAVDIRTLHRGRRCGGYTKFELVNIIWYLHQFQPTPPSQLIEETSREEMINRLRKNIGYDYDLSTWTDQRLRFILSWLKSTAPVLCQTIRALMDSIPIGEGRSLIYYF